jgi:hypothetical protein
MTKGQRRVIEAVIRRAEKGPSLRPVPLTIEEAEREARIWSQSWMMDPLQALLDNADGKLSAAELSNYAG